MTPRPYLIRFTTVGGKAWLEGNERDYAELARAFDLDEAEQSVWEVDHPDAEIVMLAAYLLPRGNPGEGWTILRICEEDARAVGVGISRAALGKTGVPWADYRHRDLIGDEGRFIDLTRLICEEAIHGFGQDRIRRISKTQMQCIVGQPPRHRPAGCAWPSYAIPKKGYRFPSPSVMRATITTLPFPEDIIRPRAAAKASGDKVRDWLEAENELRSEYCAAFGA